MQHTFWNGQEILYFLRFVMFCHGDFSAVARCRVGVQRVQVVPFDGKNGGRWHGADANHHLSRPKRVTPNGRAESMRCPGFVNCIPKDSKKGVFGIACVKIILLEVNLINQWLIVGLGPGGLDSWDPLWKGLLLKGTMIKSPTTNPNPNQ